ncbi:MAG: [FeFe] hydrogenase H-cluster radical SAM maturase HydE [Gammaproteobacteria bacterium]|nr:[FeFe] hydrogenase H-cluster radical SAM maturase HydE [Gammaproteobacteria bacterium]
MRIEEIEFWLREQNAQKLAELYKNADLIRKENVGDAVHLRGLIEISNYCTRACAYCGLNCDQSITRYRMSHDEIIKCAKEAVEFGYGTVVLQAGEDPRVTQDFIAKIIKEIKVETDLAVTLSLGERSFDELKAWKMAGADRYLLRFETSDKKLFNLIHPADCSASSCDSTPTSSRGLTAGSRDRIAILKELKQLGYETGSGVMLGIPGQTYQSLANDIILFTKLDLDMIGIGPYIKDPNTPLGSGALAPYVNAEDQVPSGENITYKAVALTRIMRPDANIPATSALATINKANGRELALMRGANVVMPNLTPLQYRQHYTIYPDKACINETADMCKDCLAARIATIGRTIGKGQGGRK